MKGLVSAGICVLLWAVPAGAFATVDLLDVDFSQIEVERDFEGVPELLASDKAKIEEILNHFKCKGTKDCKFLERHLKRDTKKCFVHPEKIEDLPQNISSKYQNKINGKIRYLGFFRKKYIYDLWNSSADQKPTYEILTRVHIKNRKDFDPSILTVLQNRLNTGTRIWNKSHPYDYGMQFNFRLVENKKDSDFSVKLKAKQTRGPYDKNWSTKWGSWVLAHEMGHFWGLDDEYKNGLGGGNTKVCSPRSIMCQHWTGKPLPYHYYLIMRRSVCQKMPKPKLL